jgi:hypothetical protein
MHDDGTFATFVPADARVEPRASHPEFVADPLGGSVELREPRGPVTPRLARGTVAVAHRSDLAGRTGRVGARVVLCPLATDAPPMEIEASVADGDLRTIKRTIEISDVDAVLSAE